jgi:hypothetical protein
MYVDFHMLPLASLRFCLFLIWHQRLEPSFEVVGDLNLGSFFYETIYDAASIIDYSIRSLLMPVSSIAPHPSKDADNLRLCHHSKAQSATASKRPTLSPVIVFHLNGSCRWTLAQDRVNPSQILCGALCPSPTTWSQEPIVPR